LNSGLIRDSSGVSKDARLSINSGGHFELKPPHRKNMTVKSLETRAELQRMSWGEKARTFGEKKKKESQTEEK